MVYYLSNRYSHTVIGGLRGLRRFLWFTSTFVGMVVVTVTFRALLPVSWHATHGRALRAWLGRRLSRAAGARVRRANRRPGGAAVIVSNHLSWLDSFVFLGELGARFVASRQWGSLPVLRTAMRATGVVFIERTKLRDTQLVGEALRRLVDRGETVMMYPEADTTRGATVKPFRAGLLQPAAEHGLPVAWAALRYETPPGWPPASVVASWADWTPLLLHMYRAFHVPRLIAHIIYSETSVTGANRKELAAALHTEVVGAFEPQEQLRPEELALIHVPPSTPPARF